MEAKRLMSLEVVTVPPDLTVEGAHRIMLERGLRHLPVVSGEKLAGMLADRDVLLAIGRGPRGQFFYPQVTVGELMSLAPVSASPSASVAELAKAMLEAKIDALPIVTAKNVLAGLVTSTDLMRLLLLVPQEKQPSLDFQIRRAADLRVRA